jgi:hypothetical protein
MEYSDAGIVKGAAVRKKIFLIKNADTLQLLEQG